MILLTVEEIMMLHARLLHTTGGMPDCGTEGCWNRLYSAWMLDLRTWSNTPLSRKKRPGLYMR